MPNQVGTELLGRVRRAHPQIVRILTTAYADLEATIEAVNSGAIFKYVVKPWDIRELRVTLLRAMEYFMLRRERDLLLREKLSTLEQLLIADRVRSLAILAQGLSSQIRNTMTALLAYVSLAKEQLQFRFPKQAIVLGGVLAKCAMGNRGRQSPLAPHRAEARFGNARAAAHLRRLGTA